MIATDQREVKIALMGPSGAGKSHALRVLQGKDGSAKKTVGAQLTHHHLVTSLGEKVKVNIWDCAGTRSYERLVAIHIQRSDSILVFYSPYKKESFEEAKEWLQLIREREYPRNKVWIVRSIRNDEDYKILEEGKAYFESQGYRHVDLKDYDVGDISKLIGQVVQAIPKPPEPEVESPKKFEGIRFGDLVFDSEWLEKYIQILHDEEKTAKKEKEQEENHEKAKAQIMNFYEKKYSRVPESKQQGFRKDVRPIHREIHVHPQTTQSVSFYLFATLCAVLTGAIISLKKA